MVSDVTLCPAVCRFANLLITVLLLNMKRQLTIGDFIAKKMKTRDINVMQSFNGFTVVNFTTVKPLKDCITLMSRVFIFLAIKSPIVSWRFIFNNNTVINRLAVAKRHTAEHRVTSLTIETARYHI